MIDVHCEHCGRRFEVPKELKGGITNCPHCGKANEIEGLNDPVWLLIRGGSAVGAILFGVAIGAVAGPAVGVAAGVAGLGAIWLLFKLGG